MICIPARLASSRFPRKVLQPIEGIPMVIRTAQAVSKIDEVVIAVDSEEVLQAAKDYGFRAILTSPSCQNGTERIYEAVQKLSLSPDEIILNVQADEPFIEPDVVQKVHDLTLKHKNDKSVLMCSCYKEVDHLSANDPNLVKTVIDHAGFALYFSRAKIPYNTEDKPQSYFAHIGIYGYSVSKLEIFRTLPPSAPEESEKLEQLRALSHGYRIAMTKVKTSSFGIDTPQDLQKALALRTQAGTTP